MHGSADVVRTVIANPDRLPLRERHTEVRRIVGAIRAAGRGKGALFIVEGPTGIGRTRLLLEVADLARRRHGMAVLQVRLTADEPGRSLHMPTLPADPGRTLVIVDDIQRCEPLDMRGLVSYISDARERGAVALVARSSGRLRHTDPGPPARLSGDRSATFLRLAPLSERSVGVLLARHLRIAPDARFTAACHLATGGYPALVEELALRLIELAIAPVESNVGIVESVALAPVGRRVLARLYPPDRWIKGLMIASAVLGEGTPVTHAAALARVPESRIGDAIDALVGCDVLVASDHVRFAAPLVARSLLAASRPSELAQWHRRAADVLDAADAPIEEIASHLRRAAPAGDRTVVGRLRLGAHRARQAGDCAAAIADLRRAVQEGVPEFAPDLEAELRRLDVELSARSSD
jgi:hypothetical protein